MARPEKRPTAAQREQVETMVAYGIPLADVAKVIGISQPTLRKYCSEEIGRAVPRANAQVAGFLFNAARRGNVTAQIFWLKTRAHWKDVQTVEHANGDGGPVQHHVKIEFINGDRDKTS